MNPPIKGVTSLIGGTIVMIVIGSLYTFGTFTSYIASYLHYHDNPEVQTVNISLVFPFLLTFMNVGVIIGYLFQYN